MCTTVFLHERAYTIVSLVVYTVLGLAVVGKRDLVVGYGLSVRVIVAVTTDLTTRYKYKYRIA